MVFKTTEEFLIEAEKKLDHCLACGKKHCYKKCQFYLPPGWVLRIIREYKRLLPREGEKQIIGIKRSKTEEIKIIKE